MSGEKSKGIGIIIVLLILAIAIAFISFYYVKISKTEDANKIAALEAEIETLKAFFHQISDNTFAMFLLESMPQRYSSIH